MTVGDRLRAAGRPRMLVLLAVLLVAAAVFGRLGAWQLDRAFQRAAERADAAAAASREAPPVPLADVLAPQTTFTSDLVGRRVVVTGEYGTDQLLVPGRVHDGATGSLVLTPLQVEGSDAVLAVVRGWVEDDAPPPPTGPVTLTGWLQAGEAAGTLGLPEGQVDAISPAELVNRWGGPAYTGYVVVESPVDNGVTALEPPSRTGAGFDWRNLGYAVQWWLFGLFAVGLWWRMLGDEVRNERPAEQVAVPGPGAGSGPGGVDGIAGSVRDGGAANGHRGDGTAAGDSDKVRRGSG